MFYIDQLQLKNFRNYTDEKMSFNPRLNLIIGNNGQGKTNLLEAIFYLSLTRSFRTSRDQEMIGFGDSYFFIRGHFFKDDLPYIVQTSYKNGETLKVLINDNNRNRYDHMQDLPVIIFSPDDMQIISEGPALRRRFLNLECSRLSAVHFQELRDYQRVLMQRNFLLREKRFSSNLNRMLEPWDHALAALGCSIIKVRIAVISALEKEVKYFFEEMTGNHEHLSLRYSSTVSYDENGEMMIENFLSSLREKRESEIKRSSSIIGPHLDDLKILINNNDARKYSSQGQKRTAALALRMAEARLFKIQNKILPIVLLDDVFSEFDRNRRNKLLGFLKDNSGQCFISSASDLPEVAEQLGRDLHLLTIDKGKIIDEKGRIAR